ncbi:hypothetical protein [Roseimaritima ulvae]|uniref:hypothetical protein n=1 Tax=Roseimaritima ulvae TaxID=980254 RepID=UPI0012FA053D|nr:hypothetical protein [Roseimaritima ulvae]
MIVWLLVISFLAVALAVTGALVLTERRHRTGLQQLLSRILQKGSLDDEED